ncbi:TetR/AcrR family transcriptional regulator C-terminal domain-containing protein [Sphaerisporangium corydalis]|uniref:TetR/AcrR family transcriptional regulator C-terminal domain-containing protein n=1 Tax=Sphaerisporangium corydalis TaxID=1441875 RepID=A0ABV9EVZ7_9ACTN|nr:TetR/AcrR family transcriptional regulator C-terminal domain-containing protein [Sphaerisporangium corydalis]
MSRERVLDAALDLVDQVGVSGLSMRRLGAALGVEAMTIYYYVPNKDAVLDGLVERIMTRAFVVSPHPDWRRLIRDFAVSFRRELLAHPGVVQLVATRPVTTPDAMRMLEAIVVILREAGFGLREAFHVVNTVAMFTTGQCLAEVDPPGSPPPKLPDMDPSDFPNALAAIHAGLGTPEDHESRFHYALNALIRGLSPDNPPQP